MDEYSLNLVKENVHGYESTSLANDDVVRCLNIIEQLIEYINKLKGKK